jgi:hypothetical protein
MNVKGEKVRESSGEMGEKKKKKRRERVCEGKEIRAERERERRVKIK